MKSFSAFSKATEKISTSPAPGPGDRNREKPTGLAGRFNIPGSSAIPALGRLGPRAPLPQPSAQSNDQSSDPNGQQVEQKSLNESMVNGTVERDSPRENKTQFRLNIPKQLRGMTNLSEVEIDLSGGDISIVSDTKKKERKDGLCTACSKINFEQFDFRNASTFTGWEGRKFTHKLIFLDRILRKKKNASCHFCSLLFDAIAHNDPFEQPAVKDHLPRDLVGKTFKQWAESMDWTSKIALPLYQAAYPFGRSRDNVELQQAIHGDAVVVVGSTNNDELLGNDAAKVGSVAAVAGLNAAMWTETDTERVKIMATVGTVVPTVTSLMTSLDAKLPVAVSIIIHNIEAADSAGLLNVDVWGYGNAHRAPLSRLSTFNLRIASGYTSSVDGNLSYGKLLQPHIDVEGNCKMWLANCCQRHGKRCEEPSWWNELPSPSGPHFRLIDVADFRVVQLDIASLRPEERPKYAALSYVWGAVGKQCLNLQMRNLEQLSTQLGGQALPIAKTITDAIAVTKKIGLRYLWVDSLCIIQHDFRGEDNPAARLSQIEQMDRIFGHAAITIVAADGLDAEAGLSGVSSTPARSQIAREVQPNINVLLAVQYSTSYGKWDTRAWTLQEKLLSKRMLIFNGGYVSFHCRHGVLREDMPASHAGNGPAQIPWVSLSEEKSKSQVKYGWDGAPVLLRSPFFTQYANLLAQYTSRDLTNSSDALNAVLGLLKVLEKMTSSSDSLQSDLQTIAVQGNPHAYTLHGLPEKFLDLALLWQPPAMKGVHLTKRSHGNLPSWSWIGWEVSKDPDVAPYSTAAGYAAKRGVRFEEPFWVATNDDLSLRKVIASAKGDDVGNKPNEERFKPLVLWWKCFEEQQDLAERTEPNLAAAKTAPRLVLINGHGLGLALTPADQQQLLAFRDGAIKFLLLHPDSAQQPPPLDLLSPPSLPAGIPIDSRHLICTTFIASFRLRSATPRTERLWKRTQKGLVVETELIVPEVEVLLPGSEGAYGEEVVGRVVMTDQRKRVSGGLYDFIVLSEAQFWGDEKRVDVVGMPFYNVLVVEWDTRKEFAARLGIGKVRKDGWWKAQPRRDVVVLN